MAQTAHDIQRLVQEIRQLAELAGLSEQQVNKLISALERMDNNVDDVIRLESAITNLHLTFIRINDDLRNFGGNQRHYRAHVDQIDVLEQRLNRLAGAFRNLNAQGGARPAPIPVAGAGGAGAQGPPPRSFQSMATLLNSPFVSGTQAATRVGAFLGQQQTSTGQAFGFGDITGVTKDAVTGITRVSVASKTAEGDMESFTFTVDKLGKVTTRTSSNFKSFAANIGRNTLEFLKWTLAMAVVVGPLQMLNEQVEALIRNQAELAAISVIVGQNQEKLAGIFVNAADAAYLTAESISGVLQGYSQAIRATGDIADQNERLATANVVLIDSLILSKLSTLDQAKSMDILVAALRQAEIPLDQGRELLDIWVATTKVANVDLRTLAESYAIVGTTAKNAGIEIGATNNELVGLVAVLAEQTQLTPTETGNAMRAIIAGLNTDVAIDELRNFGIAVRDSSGEMRGFMDVMEEVAALAAEGLIEDSQLGQIARAIGGGVRRQAQVEIVLKNLIRAKEVSQQVAGASGAAMSALEIQTQTLESSMQRLSTSVQKLVEGLGTDGGLLEAATSVLGILETLVHVTDQLSSSMGKSLPWLLALGGIALGGRMAGTNPFLAMSGGIDNFLLRRTNYPRYNDAYGTQQIAPTGFMRGATPGQLALGGITSAFAVGSMAQRYADEGQDEAATAATIGGVLGATIGAYLGGPMGMTIGATIGSGFLGAVAENWYTIEGDIGLALYRALETEGEAGFGETETKAETYEEKADEATLQALIALGNLLQQDVPMHLRRSDEEAGRAFVENNRLLYNAQNLFNREAADFDEAQFLANELVKRNPELVSTIYAPLGGQTEEALGIDPLQIRAKGIREDYGDLFNQIQLGGYDQLQQGIMAGTLGSREAEVRRGAIGGLPASLTNFMSSMLGGADTGGFNIGDQFVGMEEGIERISKMFIQANDDEREFFNQLIADIADLERMELDILAGGDAWEEYGDTAASGLQVVQAELNATRQLLSQYAGDLEQQIAYRLHEIPSFAGVGDFDLGNEQLWTEFMRRLESFQDIIETAKFGDNEAFKEQYRSELSPLTAESEYGQFRYAGRFDAKAARMAVDSMEVDNLLGDGLTDWQNPSIMNFDFLRGSMQDQFIKQNYAPFVSALEQAGVYREQPTDVLVNYAGEQLELMRWDSTIVQMLLGQIEENTSDMVDGIYNLPTDASFMVPLLGAQLRPQGGTGTSIAGLSVPEIIEGLLANFGQETIGGGRPEPGVFGMAGAAGVYGEGPPGASKGAQRQMANFLPFLESLGYTMQGPPLSTEDFLERAGYPVYGPPETTEDTMPTINLQVITNNNVQTFLDGLIISENVSKHIAESASKHDGATSGATQSFVI